MSLGAQHPVTVPMLLSALPLSPSRIRRRQRYILTWTHACRCCQIGPAGWQCPPRITLAPSHSGIAISVVKSQYLFQQKEWPSKSPTLLWASLNWLGLQLFSRLEPPLSSCPVTAENDPLILQDSARPKQATTSSGPHGDRK